MRLQGFMGIKVNKLNVLSTDVYIITSCSCGCKSLEYFVMPVVFYVFQESF